MSLLQDILNFVKPEINAELSALSNTITANIPQLEQEFASSGQTLVAFAQAKLAALVAKNPFLSAANAMFAPQLAGFLAGLEAEGEAEVGPFFTKVAAWLVKEEANV